MRPERNRAKRGGIRVVVELHEGSAHAHRRSCIDGKMEVLGIIRASKRCNCGELVAKNLKGGLQLKAIEDARNISMLGLECMEGRKGDVQVLEEFGVE